MVLRVMNGYDFLWSPMSYKTSISQDILCMTHSRRSQAWVSDALLDEGDETPLVQELLLKFQDFNDSQSSRHSRLASDPLRHLYTPELSPTPLYLGTPAMKNGNSFRDAAIGPNLGHLLGLVE
jgi:hypothetical protein